MCIRDRAIDALRAQGLSVVPAYQVAFAGYAMACALSFLWLNGWHWQTARQRLQGVARP